MSGSYHVCFWKIFRVRLFCDRTVPLVNVPLVVTACSAVRIPRASLHCLMWVVGVMATGGARGAPVQEPHVPSTHVILITFFEYLVFVGQSL